MNSEIIEEKENWSEVKIIREKYSFERFKSLRDKFVTENRKKIETLNFQNNPQFVDLIQKQEVLKNLLNTNQKLRASQSKEIKQLLRDLRNCSKQDQKLFTAIIDHNSFLMLHKCLLEHQYCSLEIKHEALWNIAITSTFKLSKEKAEYLIVPLIYTTSMLVNQPKVNQLILLEKILFSLTNFLIDNTSLGETLQNTVLVQKFSVSLLDEHNADYISLALWFIRNLLKVSKKAFEESLADFSLQSGIFSALKNYSQDKMLLFELLWTLTHISEVPTNYESIGQNIILILLDIVSSSNDECVLLPVLSIIGNAFTSLSEQTIKTVLETNAFPTLLERALLSNNFLAKREALFLLSNMAGLSKESAYFVIQKEDLLGFIMNIIQNQEPFVYKEALWVLFNLCFMGEGCYFDCLKERVQNTFAAHKTMDAAISLDDDIKMIHEKFYTALTE